MTFEELKSSFDKEPEVAKQISNATLETLVTELNKHGYNVTKASLVELAKQKNGGGSIESASIVYTQFLIG